MPPGLLPLPAIQSVDTIACASSRYVEKNECDVRTNSPHATEHSVDGPYATRGTQCPPHDPGSPRPTAPGWDTPKRLRLRAQRKREPGIAVAEQLNRLLHFVSFFGFTSTNARSCGGDARLPPILQRVEHQGSAAGRGIARDVASHPFVGGKDLTVRRPIRVTGVEGPLLDHVSGGGQHAVAQLIVEVHGPIGHLAGSAGRDRRRGKPRFQIAAQPRGSAVVTLR